MVFTTTPLGIVDLPADEKHFTRGRKSQPRVIVLHATGGTDSRKWLTTTSKPVVSCNRLIMKDGTNYKIVADEDTAYAQGFSTMGPYSRNAGLTMNDIGLSIEFENMSTGVDPYPFVQVDMGAAQVYEWWGKYGYLPILTHGMIYSPKSDPKGFPWSRFYQVLRAMHTSS